MHVDGVRLAEVDVLQEDTSVIGEVRADDIVALGVGQVGANGGRIDVAARNRGDILVNSRHETVGADVLACAFVGVRHRRIAPGVHEVDLSPALLRADDDGEFRLVVDGEQLVVFRRVGELNVAKANAENALARDTADLHARIAYDEEVDRKNTEIQTLVNTIKTYEENLRVMRENPVMSLDFSTVSLERYESEKNRLASELEDLRRQQIQRAQLDAARAELSGIRSDIQRVQAKLNDTHPDLRGKLWEVNDLFRSKNFPTKVAFAIYKKLEERLNVYLSEFNAPYKVEMLENGDFDCVFDSGLHQLSARLSGGQKMVLAIAFRIALHSVFATDDTGGFVALDEPTTFLDEKNRDALCSVLNTLKTSPLFRDLQIFVVTHDDMLRPLFNCLVDLEG